MYGKVKGGGNSAKIEMVLLEGLKKPIVVLVITNMIHDNDKALCRTKGF